MCGILFYLSTDTSIGISPLKQSLFNQSLSGMGHRGPDGSGIVVTKNAIFGHNRLSILDLSENSAQPIVSEITSNVLIYNGEIYNFRELHSHYFPDQVVPGSDTLVLLKLLDLFGDKIVAELNGMFSFVYYEVATDVLVFCRDRLGIKPLYIEEGDNEIVISSELKGIFPLKESLPLFNTNSLGEWSYYGNVLGESTIYKHIKKASPGVVYRYDVKKREHTDFRYWSAADYSVRRSTGIKKEKNVLLNVVRSAVSRQLVSDVPVGVFLSGGIDSSAIAKIAAEESGGVLHTYTATFDYGDSAEEALTAKRLSKEIGTEHHEIHVGTNDLEKLVTRMINNHDGPFSDAASIPLSLLCDQVDDGVKVILQGDGGDELFGGYNRYSLVPYFGVLNAVSGVSNYLKIRNKSIIRIMDAFSHRNYLATFAYLLTEDMVGNETYRYFDSSIQSCFTEADCIRKYLDAEVNEQQDVSGNLSVVDIQNILPDIFLEKVDRSTMGSSKEIRVPLLDNEILDYCLSLRGRDKWPYGQKKHLLREALSQTLPSYVLNRKKHGFGVPYGRWLKDDLKNMFLDNLNTFCLNNPNVLDRNKIEKGYLEFCLQDSGSGFTFWKLFIFVTWFNNGRIFNGGIEVCTSNL